MERLLCARCFRAPQLPEVGIERPSLLMMKLGPERSAHLLEVTQKVSWLTEKLHSVPRNDRAPLLSLSLLPSFAVASEDPPP